MKRLTLVFRSHRDAWLKLGVVVAGAVCLLSLGGCADADRPVDNSAMLPEDQRVSSVPWNKPEGWENKGPLGQLANDPRLMNH